MGRRDYEDFGSSSSFFFSGGGEFKITKHDLCCFLVKQELLQHFTALIPHKHSRRRAVKRKVGSRCKTTPLTSRNHFLHHQRETLITSYNLQSNMPFNDWLILFSLSLTVAFRAREPHSQQKKEISSIQLYSIYTIIHTTLYRLY